MVTTPLGLLLGTSSCSGKPSSSAAVGGFSTPRPASSMIGGHQHQQHSSSLSSYSKQNASSSRNNAAVEEGDEEFVGGGDSDLRISNYPHHIVEYDFPQLTVTVYAELPHGARKILFEVSKDGRVLHVSYQWSTPFCYSSNLVASIVSKKNNTAYYPLRMKLEDSLKRARVASGDDELGDNPPRCTMHFRLPCEVVTHESTFKKQFEVIGTTEQSTLLVGVTLQQVANHFKRKSDDEHYLDMPTSRVVVHQEEEEEEEKEEDEKRDL